MQDRRMGQPRTEAERAAQHQSLYGTSSLPRRGTGLTLAQQHGGIDWKLILIAGTAGLVGGVVVSLVRQTLMKA